MTKRIDFNRINLSGIDMDEVLEDKQAAQERLRNAKENGDETAARKAREIIRRCFDYEMALEKAIRESGVMAAYESK
jgi:hypothetical protein